MTPPIFPREEGFRYFLHTLGRRYANPYPVGHAGHDPFEAGWRHAAHVCGQEHLARMALGDVAEDLPVANRRAATPADVPGPAVEPPPRVMVAPAPPAVSH